jgi:hypothetical protein
MIWLNHFDLLFGANSIILSTPISIGWFKDLAFILYSHSNVYLSLAFLIAVLCLSVLNLFTSKFSYLSGLILWILVTNIHNKLYPSITGGDLLLNQFLFFNVLISASFIKNESFVSSLRVCFHNLAIVAVMLQLCIVYFLSGLAKIGDIGWISGTAIISVSQIRHFSLYSSLGPDSILNPIYIFLNYLVLFYQLLFPILVWLKKIKKVLLSIGILMHIYIGFVMGLPEFSAIMIIAYVYFWPPKASIA